MCLLCFEISYHLCYDTKDIRGRREINVYDKKNLLFNYMYYNKSFPFTVQVKR